MKALIDPHGRRVRKLRISLTDKCNLRCHYCMPLDATFMNESKYLSPHEYHQLVAELCTYGLEELRITGGEPLLRRDFADITSQLAGLPLKKIGITTNGILLDRHLEHLQKNRIHHLNISLDSLNPETFHKITHGHHLERLLKNIEAARKMDFNIKINMVTMRGVNDHEIFAFVDYAKRLKVPVRFLELMRIGVACDKQSEQFISAQEIIESLKTRYSLKPLPVAMDSTSFNYEVDNGAEIGFIASESQAFCGQCSRWRLSADGILRACLLKDEGLSIKGTSLAQRDVIYHTLLGMKPFRRPAEVTHQMNTIGG